MSGNPTFLLLLVFLFAVCLPGNGVYAFGAGNIPSFAYMEGKAFRHGDIEDALAELVKKGAGGFALASIIGKGSKFGGLDIKRVYFGNWLRDYSQAVDIAGLKKLPLQTIINLCMVLGFMAHGYATNEFEVTPERLGVYLPTEHIDNPKGYGEGEDARKYHPQLRGPVDPREIEIDHQTGMKNYIANESGGWDTSKALVRRTLEKCIHLGRQQRAQGRKQDEYEAYRLLGQALHTLEDFSAHSNFCEIALVSMGYKDVFLHVGDQVRIQAPNGQWVAPIVTGTFGGSDFIHSLLGEAGDKLSEASVSDLNKKLDDARSTSARSGGSYGSSDVLRSMFSSLPGGMGGDMSRDMDNIERIRAGPAQGGKRPEDMSPQELHSVLWQILSFRDSVAKKIEKTIEKIPGLGALIDKIMDGVSVFVFSTIEPFVKPLLQTATTGLAEASNEVINSHDQYEVFNDPRASDPTHSFLSKDHFNLILNEPAGEIAKVVLVNTVTLVTKAWDDTSINVHQVTEDILSALFHPDFMNRNSKVQNEMMQCMQKWVQSLGSKQHEIIGRLSKESVRKGNNKRSGSSSKPPEAQGTFAWNEGQQAQHALLGYANQIPGVAQAQHLFGGGSGNRREGDNFTSPPGPPSSGYPGAHYGHSHEHSHNAPPLPSTGQASSYYGGGTDSSSSYHSGGTHSPAPSFPGATSEASFPGAPSFPGASSASYAPPSGAPPAHHQHHHHSGYNPSYSSAPSFPGAPSEAPAFPDAPPAFPGGGGGYSGYGQGPPGGFSPPPGAPPDGVPSFPGAEPYSGYPPHGQGPPHFPQAPYGGSSGW
ncbi:heterokaryon incompatibility protein HET-C [Desarmillaria tabescens]|uniref:Heterokaryon incompatibility protein HET-C n=1 Tax=Armillaria tabescens TaxID=1929756 RepID=A0AA39N5C9_ARMTA|nr:heterokaryon incompatibility protein HET-C [Desarmillaria tabescens]KAK0457999.1 heterokaryon incompatibility protein HET-C [Desarmillaria tabescens]